MSLLYPTYGKLIVDGVEIDPQNSQSWQKNISHVPQSIFLIDSTIKQNITFGLDESQIDNERLVWASKNACIHDFIQSLPDQYDTKVGERGVRLSGGQMQRIGIEELYIKNLI